MTDHQPNDDDARIEKVARAICEGLNGDPDDTFEEPYTPAWHDCIDQARVALGLDRDGAGAASSLHRPVSLTTGGRPICDVDEEPWPCRTATALDAARVRPTDEAAGFTGEVVEAPGWHEDLTAQRDAALAANRHLRDEVDRLTRERDDLQHYATGLEKGAAARLADEGQREAVKLVEYALHLRQYGERAPGGDETWAQFDRDAERFLRTQPVPRPGHDDGSRA